MRTEFLGCCCGRETHLDDWEGCGDGFYKYWLFEVKMDRIGSGFWLMVNIGTTNIQPWVLQFRIYLYFILLFLFYFSHIFVCNKEKFLFCRYTINIVDL
jgi:hypothetical protein